MSLASTNLSHTRVNLIGFSEAGERVDMQARERYATATASAAALNEVIDTVSLIQRATINRMRRIIAPALPSSEPVFDMADWGVRAAATAAKSVGWAGANVVAPVLAITAHPESAQLSSSDKGSKWLAGFGAAFGDHLHGSAHTRALAPGMTIRCQGAVATVREAASGEVSVTGHACIFVHGLGLTEQHWNGEVIASARTGGGTPLLLRYTTGLPIAANGEQLAETIRQVAAQWPVPLTRITIVGHSMGGLVARRGIEILAQSDPAIAAIMADLITLGSPHRGSAIEKGANLALIGLNHSAILAPLVALGNRRSAGVKDLRHGAIRPTDWGGRHPDGVISDRTENVPLPTQTRHHAVIATVHEDPNHPTSWLVGDGAVRVNSAKAQPGAPAASTTVLAGTSHMQLLSHPRVAGLVAAVTAEPVPQPA